MKNSAFTIVIVLVLIALAFAAGKFLNDEHDKGYDAGKREVLEEWTTTDLLDYVRDRDGLDEILCYINDHDNDAVLDYVLDQYLPEDLPFVRDAANDAYAAGRRSILDELTLSDGISFLDDRYGSYEIMDYLQSKYRMLSPEQSSDLYVFAFSHGYRLGRLNAWNEEIEEYVDGYLFSPSESSFYSSFAPYTPRLR